MFNVYLGIYIVVAIVIITGGSFKIYNMNQSLSAFLFFIGTLFIFIIYGIKWFGEKKSIFSKTPVSWPPSINTCPDYLVFYDRKKSDGTSEDTCIDMIGVSKNGSLKVFPKGNNQSDIPSDNDYYFPLTTKGSDPVSKKSELCQRAIAMGLIWEGITNGESCIMPDGNVTPATSNNSNGGCPA